MGTFGRWCAILCPGLAMALPAAGCLPGFTEPGADGGAAVDATVADALLDIGMRDGAASDGGPIGADARDVALGDGPADVSAPETRADASVDSSDALAPADGQVDRSTPEAGLDAAVNSSDAQSLADTKAGTDSAGPSCAPSELLCDGGCVGHSVNNCASCGNACPPGLPVCSPSGTSYACATGCLPSQALCGSSCTDTASDQNNCGGCGLSYACKGGKTCQSSTCACPTSKPMECGGTCRQCSAPANATAICNGTACDFSCNSSYLRCGNACCQPCGPSTCNGCCKDATTCVLLGSETNVTCGASGSACMDCSSSGNVCSASGQCVPPPTWCNQQTIPSGVASSDYQCVDFDRGLPPSNTWAQTTTGGGNASISTARASSPPNSLLTMPPFGGAGSAILSWADVGPAPISSVSLTAVINPASDPGIVSNSISVSLLSFTFSQGDHLFLQYTFGGGSQPSLQISYFGPMNAALCPFQATLTSGVWNTIQMQISSSGLATAVVNGTTGTCNTAIGPDTSVTIGFGVDASFPWSAYYDNVIAVVHR